MRFGLNGSKEYTLEQVAKIPRVTRERAQQKEALRMLRHPSGLIQPHLDLRAWFGKGKGDRGGGWDLTTAKANVLANVVTAKAKASQNV